MAQKEKDALSGVETTGHEWDGLRELNNPLPKWWLYIFYVCIAWSLVYYVLYPAWPLGKSYTKGLLGYSQREELVQKVADGKKAQEKYLTAIAATSVEDIQKNKDLLAFAMAGGRSYFNENCAACHGAGGQGAKGFPTLADDVWLWGGTTADIYKTIQHGIRADDGDTRGTVGIGMTAFGRDGILNRDQIGQVAEYILSLNKRSTDAAAAEKGKTVYDENCAACHGENAQGSLAVGMEVGAPPLVTANWLYGGDKATLVQTITNGRAGVMPAWSKRLDDATIKSLAVYVHNLGGGK
ncbi:cytochrome-c oxidase, cbb3-type subunit III [Azospirillum brasilense]|uniref:Cbb3-type cytochrome c oxidase subunit n=1 Tax=Azospirillum brasilense TaxID=192 RepID=A0A0P0EVP6_AZOBR|nr:MULTISPECIES: cytochrome-c oxidase, cbb3-type subunit III [Azospirillum]ALJ34104.1 cytochrome C oxidase Cbb3 [Azospirillum brasilense]MBK3733966.1 cytochrome-c oxidase, cbb3-type subunit III [Azospirillum brasilense]MDW7552921.1 cytochrome-c oxidase, cbb3-type subunit III [Azospirillum brasilense]MDW7591887.1 cytochrome-c oxidase, cbb3-type subunit III [Azospirillum brasilense]MDW7627836.1 cytochrome-c oxidase, cbb3-type subunit III [Azospirillum brasilense]